MLFLWYNFPISLPDLTVKGNSLGTATHTYRPMSGLLNHPCSLSLWVVQTTRVRTSRQSRWVPFPSFVVCLGVGIWDCLSKLPEAPVILTSHPPWHLLSSSASLFPDRAMTSLRVQRSDCAFLSLSSWIVYLFMSVNWSVHFFLWESNPNVYWELAMCQASYHLMLTRVLWGQYCFISIL